jgi:mannitol/fructose-specific phosphotransferase system IIA component (Ntr-type)
MKVSDVLKVSSIRTGLKGAGKTKTQVIRKMIDILVDSFDLSGDQKLAVEKAILDREGQKSTGMANGVAIPHGKTELVEGLIAAMGIFPKSIEFGTLDNKPVNFVFCMVSDLDHAKEHLQTLSQIMRIFRGGGVALDILRATEAKKVMNILKHEEKELGGVSQ